VFGRNLRCQPVRGVSTQEECHWSHACKSFKQSKGVKLNGTPRVQTSCRKACTVQQPQPDDPNPNPNPTESMVKAVHRAVFSFCHFRGASQPLPSAHSTVCVTEFMVRQQTECRSRSTLAFSVAA
jgi:hypothetical protein